MPDPVGPDPARLATCQRGLTVRLCLADCLLHEENFSVRCPKHKVSPRPLRRPLLGSS